MESIGTWWMWAGFFALVLIMLAIDLFAVGGGRRHRVSLREAGLWSAIWVGVTLTFAGALWLWLDGSTGREAANTRTLEFLTGYLIEKSLAVDNVFVLTSHTPGAARSDWEWNRWAADRVELGGRALAGIDVASRARQRAPSGKAAINAP